MDVWGCTGNATLIRQEASKQATCRHYVCYEPIPRVAHMKGIGDAQLKYRGKSLNKWAFPVTRHVARSLVCRPKEHKGVPQLYSRATNPQ